MSSTPTPGRARPRWVWLLLALVLVAAAALAGVEVYAGHYQPLKSAGYLKPVPSSTVHRVNGSGTDYTGPAGAHLQLEFGLVDSGPFDVHVTAVTALPGTVASWSISPNSGPIDPKLFKPFGATISGHNGIRVLLDVPLPTCRGRSVGFDTVSVHWSALGRRHVTAVRVLGDIPIEVCAGS